MPALPICLPDMPRCSALRLAHKNARTFHMYCDTFEDMVMWMEALKTASTGGEQSCCVYAVCLLPRSLCAGPDPARACVHSHILIASYPTVCECFV